MRKPSRSGKPEETRAAASESPDEDTEGQSLQNYELVRAISHERQREAARLARDNARAREAREAKRGR